MKSYSKAGLLVAILVIPALIFLFLKNFGKNHFRLPVFFAMDSVKTDKGYEITNAHAIPEFTLTTHNGRNFSFTEFKDDIKVIDFFFTRCGSICPKMTNQLTRIQEVFEKDEDIKILSITVDPLYDTPDTLKNYADQYGANNKWLFLTGEKDTIYKLAQKGFFLSAMEDQEHPVDFIHSEKIVLVDKNGWIRGYYNGTDKKDVDRLIDEIRVLKNIYKE